MRVKFYFCCFNFKNDLILKNKVKILDVSEVISLLYNFHGLLF